MRGLVIGALITAGLVVAGLIAFDSGVLSSDRGGTEPLTISPAAASSAESKIQRLAGEGEEVRLSAAELTSLFRYRPEMWALGIVHEPTVEIDGQTLILRGSVPTDEIPPQPELESIRYLLPDTTDLAVAGTLGSAGPGTSVLEVASLEIAGMPIPSRLFPLILERLGRSERLPPNTIELPLPDAMSSARIENGELVLSP